MNTHAPTKCIGYKGTESHLQRPLRKKNSEKDLRDEDSPKRFLNQSVFLFCSKVMTP